MNIYGAAKCHWTETETKESGFGRHKRYQTIEIPFSGDDVYMNTTTYLLGEAGGGMIELLSGIHRFEFSCPLSPHLPQSVDGKYGNISYTCVGGFDRPWSGNELFRTDFTIVRHDDLNESPGLQIPIKSEESNTFCCFICESDRVTMTVTIPRAGYVPGHNIPVTVEYVNKSSYAIENTHIYLNRFIEFKRFALNFLNRNS